MYIVHCISSDTVRKLSFILHVHMYMYVHCTSPDALYMYIVHCISTPDHPLAQVQFQRKVSWGSQVLECGHWGKASELLQYLLSLWTISTHMIVIVHTCTCACMYAIGWWSEYTRLDRRGSKLITKTLKQHTQTHIQMSHH